ncbi:MAG: zinc-ribbon domain-containing protein [Eggerthellaceae bacterium]|nr:zinc-ribbon domain-containing protein [Eggerthellaceae bacterium]
MCGGYTRVCVRCGMCGKVDQRPMPEPGTCVRCGHENDPQSPTCSACGAPIPKLPGAPGGSLRGAQPEASRLE